MPLAWQKFEVPFGFGIDETAHRFIQSPPGVELLVNGRIDKEGQINVREGWDAVASRSSTERLVAFKDRLYAIYSDPSALTSNVELALDCMNNDEQRFDKQGGKNTPSALTECTIDGRSIVTRSQQSSFSGADIGVDESSGLAVIAWVGLRGDPALLLGQRIYATVIDINTLATVTPIQEISTAASATDAPLSGTKVVIEGTTAHVIYVDVNANTIRCKDYNLSTKTWGNDTALETNAESAPAPVFDAVDSGAGVWYLAYRDTIGQLRIDSYIGTGFQNQVVIADDPTCLTLYANFLDDRVWVMWQDAGTDIKWAVYDSDLVNVVSTVLLEAATVQATAMGIARMNANQALFVYTLSASSLTTRGITRFVAHTDAGVAGNVMSRYSTTLESRPMTDGAHVYAILGFRDGTLPQPSGFQSLSAFYTVALVGIGDAFSPDESTCYRTCALWAQGSALPSTAAAGATFGSVPTCLRKTFTSENKYWCVVPVVATVDNGGVDAAGTPRLVQEAGIDLCRFDLSSDDRARSAEFGQHLFFSGGQVVVFDGANIMEHGFHYPPEGCQGSIDVGGGVLSDGAYQIAIVWEYRTNSGAVMRSQPILVTNPVDETTTFTVAANDAIDVTIQHLNLTQKFNPYTNVVATERFFQAPAAIIYRTEANGSIFYREGVLRVNDVFGTGAALGTVVVGTNDDETIKASEQLYTTGGIPPNWSLPACDDVIVYKNRLFGISSEDKKQLVFTQVLSDDVPSWHPFLVQRLDDDGDCVGLAVLDDTLVVLKENAIYLLRGNGPDVKGLNSDFQITRVQSPHGCVERKSIVTDPLGVAFRSRLGLCRLTRSLQVEYFGVKVEDLTSTTTEITCSLALPNYAERLYFGITDTENGDGGFLVYQWANDQWAIDLMSGSEQSPLTPLSVAWVNGVAYCAFQGESFIFAHRGLDDPHGQILLEIVSHWFEFNGPQGFQRIRNIEFLGEWHENHDLQIYLYRDYNEVTPFQTVTFTAAELNPTELQPYQVKVHVSQQRLESLRYALIVAPQADDSNDSRCVTFVAQAFDVGAKPTLMRVPRNAMRGASNPP